MSSTLNIAVNLYRFGETKSNPAITVENKNAIEKKIVAFLDDLLGLMNEEVPKNWHYFRQYFYFWKTFANGGEWQLRYLISKEVVARFADFILDKRSPVTGFHKKGIRMGNQQCSPNFDEVLELIADLVDRANLSFSLSTAKQPTLFELSLKDKQCLYAAEFWHICLTNESKAATWMNQHGISPPSAARLIRRLANDNAVFSEVLSGAILRGLHKLSMLDSEPYLEAIHALLSLQDKYQVIRF